MHIVVVSKLTGYVSYITITITLSALNIHDTHMLLLSYVNIKTQE